MDYMEDTEEKRRIIDIIDESMIRFIKNRDEALVEVNIKELFPDKISYLRAREQFAERMEVDKGLVKKFFELLYETPKSKTK